MSNDDPTPKQIEDYTAEHAPELDGDDVRAFMDQHPKPEDVQESHLEWAVRTMREREESEFGEGLPVDRVVDELRRRPAG